MPSIYRGGVWAETRKKALGEYSASDLENLAYFQNLASYAKFSNFCKF